MCLLRLRPDCAVRGERFCGWGVKPFFCRQIKLESLVLGTLRFVEVIPAKNLCPWDQDK